MVSDTELTVEETFSTNETASITLTYRWKTGLTQAQPNSGYGAGFWNVGLYGRDQTDAVIVRQAGRWTFDNWGEDVLGVFRQDGTLFYWDASGGSYPLNGERVTNAPTNNLGVLVSQSRSKNEISCFPRC